MNIVEDDRTNLQQKVERLKKYESISILLDERKKHRKEINQLVSKFSTEILPYTLYLKTLQTFSNFLHRQIFLSDFKLTSSPYQLIFNLHDHFRDKHDKTKFIIIHINLKSLSKISVTL